MVDDAARALITRLQSDIPAFREPQPDASAGTLFAFLADVLPRIPRLRALSSELQSLAVSSKHYELSASNIRAAASLADDVSILADNLIAISAVWEYCTENNDEYLDLIESDEHTTTSCMSSEVLAQVINAQHEDWSAEQMLAFLVASAEVAALPDITQVEHSTWKTVVERLRVAPSVANLEAYITEIGIDGALAGLLTDDTGDVVNVIGLEDATNEQLEILIPHALTADATLTPSQRVHLAKQLLAAPESGGLDLSEITASPDELLAELLRAELIDDSEDTFSHFSSAGWPAIGPALQVSSSAATFLSPELVAGYAADLVQDNRVPASTKRTVLERLAEFAPTEDSAFLVSAASAARVLGVPLSTDALILVAPVVRNHEDVVWQLRELGDSLDAVLALQILGRMSGDFAEFAGSSGHKFEVTDTASLETVLNRLKVAGLIVAQPGRQPRGRWKLRIV